MTTIVVKEMFGCPPSCQMLMNAPLTLVKCHHAQTHKLIQKQKKTLFKISLQWNHIKKETSRQVSEMSLKLLGNIWILLSLRI